MVRDRLGLKFGIASSAILVDFYARLCFSETLLFKPVDVNSDQNASSRQKSANSTSDSQMKCDMFRNREQNADGTTQGCISSPKFRSQNHCKNSK